MSHVVSLSAEALNKAADILRGGGLVAVPTETVYGLAADATNADAVARIYKAKGRPSANPLICHVADIEMALRFGLLNETALRLAEAFWPGPLTLVVPGGSVQTAPAVRAGLATIALRHPIGAMAQLSALLGKPIAAPSANTSGRLSPTRAQHVAADLGDRVDLILDGGSCTAGLESTIVKPEGNSVRLLREGPVTRPMLETVVRLADEAPTGTTPESPGTHFRHYAPDTPLRLDAESANEGEALLGFGTGSGATLNLSLRGDLTEAAHNLFHMLWELDRQGHARIAVARIPEYGAGRAINDRLRRAAEANR